MINGLLNSLQKGITQKHAATLKMKAVAIHKKKDVGK